MNMGIVQKVSDPIKFGLQVGKAWLEIKDAGQAVLIGVGHPILEIFERHLVAVVSIRSRMGIGDGRDHVIGWQDKAIRGERLDIEREGL